MAFALSSKTSMVRGSAGPESMGIMARRGGRARREGSEESKNELARRQPDFFFSLPFPAPGRRRPPARRLPLPRRRGRRRQGCGEYMEMRGWGVCGVAGARARGAGFRFDGASFSSGRASEGARAALTRARSRRASRAAPHPSPPANAPPTIPRMASLASELCPAVVTAGCGGGRGAAAAVTRSLSDGPPPFLERRTQSRSRGPLTPLLPLPPLTHIHPPLSRAGPGRRTLYHR